MEIKITYNKKAQSGLKSKSCDAKFGTTFTDKMFIMNYDTEKGGWYDAQIKDFGPFVLSPAALVFHYGQEIFEGQKAYKWEDGRIVLFRPEMNIKRFNLSAGRLCMPAVDEKVFMEALDKLVWEEREWIPQEHGHSLYLRAAMIAVDPILGVRSGTQFTFFIIDSPAGCYFPEGFKPVKIWVSDKYVRAVKGGMGEAKTGGNYAASLKAMSDAREKGFSQVLWLDGCEMKYAEEVGTMNIFFVEDGKLITPALTGGILRGVTRDSVITVAKDLGYTIEERRVPIEEICDGIKAGRVTECFGSGTACVISPVGELGYKEKSYVMNNAKTGPITQSIYDQITGIQYGKVKDKFGWIKEIKPR
jgi:branched-chain amino acid aminotransferase